MKSPSGDQFPGWEGQRIGDQQLFPPPGASGSYWICGPGSFGAWRRCQLGFGSGWRRDGVLLVSRQSISLLPLLLFIGRRLCARLCCIRRTQEDLSGVLSLSVFQRSGQVSFSGSALALQSGPRGSWWRWGILIRAKGKNGPAALGD